MSTTTTRILAAVVAIALLLGGGGIVVATLVGGDDDGSPRSAAPAEPEEEAPESVPVEGPLGAEVPPDPALAAYYTQELDWQPCREDFECAELEVPLDYAEPDGETIGIALLKVPARDADRRVGSLVVNPGGPGAPGTEYAASAALVFRDPLLDAFDVVGFDPRGTGSSAPVDCLSDAELDDYVSDDPDPDTAAERATYAGWVERLGAGCVERSGDLAAHVSTVEAARDMDVLRAALGESALTYFGASYGTKLGSTYADLFPDRVGRLVLDGAVDPTLTNRELNLEQAAGFETALRAYAEDCAADGCRLGDTADEVLESIRGFIDRVEQGPLPVGERELGVGNAFYGIVAPLYNAEYWRILTQALELGIQGDASLLLQLSDLYTSRGADGYTDNSAEAIYAINCLDDPTAIEQADVPAEVAAFEEASPTFGTVFAWSLTGCGGVQVEAAEPAPEIDAPGAAPILVIGTTRDPATPYDWAVSLADQLESGVLLSRDGDGHTGYNAGNACVDQAVHGYLIAGEVPEDGLSC